MGIGMDETMKCEEGTVKKSTIPGGNVPLLKLLVPNYVAGALIGKGGELMTELNEKSGGDIRLSANRECYPGTVERIITLTGEIHEIIELNNLIIDKVRDESSKLPMDEERREKVKIVLTNAAAGLLIGRGGLTIKGIQETSEAKISICGIEVANVPGERVLTMSGTREQRVDACKQIIETIASNPSNMANTTLKYANGAIGLSAVHESAASSPFTHQGMSNFCIPAKVEIQLEVPDILVGAIMGKQGQNIYQLCQHSGAKFHFSNKNEYAPGTTDRILKITGDMNQTLIAYNLFNEKVQQLASLLAKQE